MIRLLKFYFINIANEWHCSCQETQTYMQSFLHQLQVITD